MTSDKGNFNNESLTENPTKKICNPNNEKCSNDTKSDYMIKESQSNDLVIRQKLDSNKEDFLEKQH